MRFFRWLFLATLSLVLMVQLRLIDGALTSPDTPWGVVGFELAFTRERAAAIIAVWRSMGVTDSALVSLGVDVAFLWSSVGEMENDCLKHLYCKVLVGSAS
jgi:hypothetical protein